MVSRRKGGLKKGDVLKGKYEILALIGQGGMSRVFLAQDKTLANKQWAVKEVDRQAKDQLGRPIEQSLATEADLLSKLQHPAIVDIVDIEKTDDYIYVVMDHIEGDSLDKVVRQYGPQKEEDVQNWMIQVADALSYLHRQEPPMIYRDMKPSNIMLHPDGYVKLIDFGVAREYKDEQRKDTVAFGTTGYAAPEQYGKSQTDARTDIYGMGATMWHLLGGSAPPVEFPLPNVTTVNPAVGEGFADVIIPKATALERDQRYQTADELIADLEDYRTLTREYQTKQHHKVALFGSLVISSLVCIILGLTLLGIRALHINNTVEAYVNQANDQLVLKNYSQAEQLYTDAIQLLPGDTRGYEGLIKCYEDDGILTKDEYYHFESLLDNQGNLNALKGNPQYSDLQFKAGEMIWYYYCPNDQPKAEGTVLTSAIIASYDAFEQSLVSPPADWFHKKSAETYLAIAKFYKEKDVIDRTKGDNTSLYQDLWPHLESFVNETQEITKRPLLQLANYNLATTILNTGSSIRKFSDAGISAESVTNVCNTLITQLQSLRKNTELADNLTEIDDDITKLTADVIPSIRTVYTEPILAEEGGE